jgi:hypothetical protein
LTVISNNLGSFLPGHGSSVIVKPEHRSWAQVKCLHKVLAANFAAEKSSRCTDRYRSYFHSDSHAQIIKASLFPSAMNLNRCMKRFQARILRFFRAALRPFFFGWERLNNSFSTSRPFAIDSEVIKAL